MALRDRLKRIVRELLPGTKTVYQRNNFSMTAKGLSPGVELGNNSLALWRSGVTKQIPAEKAMATYSGWVFACVHPIADAVANVEFRMFKVDPKTKDHIEIFDHDMLDLLDAPNESQTGVDLKHMIASHLEIAGNAYLLLPDVKDEMEQPTEIHLLNPGSVKVLLDKTIFPYKISGYEFRIDGNKYTYPKHQIVHIKYPDPNSVYEGIGTVQAIPQWIDNDNYAMEYNRKFFLQGARIDGVLETDVVGEAATSSLEKSFEMKHTGTENAHKIPVLPKGVKWVATQATAKDMDFANMLDKMGDRIRSGFRVSSTMMGTAEADTNRATAETADYVFAHRTIKPKMKIICAYLNAGLTSRYADDIYLSFVDPTPEDKAFRVTEMQAVVGSQPVMTTNEARETYLGLDGVEGGDTVKIASTMADLAGGGTEDPKEPDADDGKSAKAAKARRFSKALGNDGVYRPFRSKFNKLAKKRMSLAEKMAARIAEKLGEIKSKALHELTHEEYYPIWKEFVMRVDPYEAKMKENVVRYNEQVFGEIIDKLPAEFSKAIPNSKVKFSVGDLFDEQKWIELMTNLVTPDLKELYVAEAIAAAAAIGKPGIDVAGDPNMMEALNRTITIFAEKYTQTTADLVGSKIRQGLEEGLSEPEVTALVNTLKEYSNEVRAQMVARTESFRTANDATKAAWKKTGVVQTIKWYTANDGEVCAFCEAEDGKVISIDDNFYDQGDEIEAAGKLMKLDYSDVGAPPLHPDCRCYIAPEEVTLE